MAHGEFGSFNAVTPPFLCFIVNNCYCFRSSFPNDFLNLFRYTRRSLSVSGSLIPRSRYFHGILIGESPQGSFFVAVTDAKAGSPVQDAGIMATWVSGLNHGLQNRFSASSNLAVAASSTEQRSAISLMTHNEICRSANSIRRLWDV